MPPDDSENPQKGLQKKRAIGWICIVNRLQSISMTISACGGGERSGRRTIQFQSNHPTNQPTTHNRSPPPVAPGVHVELSNKASSVLAIRPWLGSPVAEAMARAATGASAADDDEGLKQEGSSGLTTTTTIQIGQPHTH